MASRPLRSCVACHAVRPKAELVRVYAAPGGVLGVDLGGGSGRGAYVCPQRSCLDQAIKRGEFARRLKAVFAPIEAAALQDLIRQRATQKVVSLLGFARRARKVVSGAEAVASAVARRAAKVVLVAADASQDSVTKIRSLAAPVGVACHECLSKAQLGAALGGAPRSCVAVTDARFAEAVISMMAKVPREKESGGDAEDDTVDPMGRDKRWEMRR